ncbi:MAG: hypothetical protein NC217_02280 [Muribaculaceae bacterium]|nr:hypothetical protein [Muribaculaceae bacterium]
MTSIRKNHKHSNKKHRFVGTLSERELFYIPGDPDPYSSKNYDNENLDDN